MAELLAAQKLESARIRVENIIRSDIGTELYEILELYCELLLARSSLLEGPVVAPTASTEGTIDGNALDSGLDEAVRSILYAAPRQDIKELSTARALLIEKFGKEYALLAAEGTGVPERVVKRVRIETPKPELVDNYLRVIGETYGVRFPGDPIVDETEEDDEDDNDEDDKDEGGGGVGQETRNDPPLAIEQDDLTKAKPPSGIGNLKLPLEIAPPSPSSENPKPIIKLPEGTRPKSLKKASAGGPAATKTPSKPGVSATAPDPAQTNAKPGEGPGGTIPDVDNLAKRLAALKRG